MTRWCLADRLGRSGQAAPALSTVVDEALRYVGCGRPVGRGPAAGMGRRREHGGAMSGGGTHRLSLSRPRCDRGVAGRVPVELKGWAGRRIAPFWPSVSGLASRPARPMRSRRRRGPCSSNGGSGACMGTAGRGGGAGGAAVGAVGVDGRVLVPRMTTMRQLVDIARQVLKVAGSEVTWAHLEELAVLVAAGPGYADREPGVVPTVELLTDFVEALNKPVRVNGRIQPRPQVELIDLQEDWRWWTQGWRGCAARLSMSCYRRSGGAQFAGWVGEQTRRPCRRGGEPLDGAKARGEWWWYGRAWRGAGRRGEPSNSCSGTRHSIADWRSWRWCWGSWRGGRSSPDSRSWCGLVGVNERAAAAAVGGGAAAVDAGRSAGWLGDRGPG